ncbi:hypothetical protein DPMN_119537 [Dreissena polymorpha]|uniref:Uncharacterized protein n=2 Tax=Dreissena polymorpha TaxID=45954 RepID=A0A9D4GQ39_DREPO|nr:hypothetical protein DPMN_119537 [Dreissena polymorpha]
MEIVVRAAPKNDIAKVDEIIQEETGGGNSTKSEIITSHPDKHIPVVVIEEDNYRSDVGVGIATRNSKKIQPVLDGARNKISVNKDRNLDADSAASDQTGQNDLKSADDTIHDYFVEFQDEMLAEGKDSTNETTYAQNETSKTVDFGQTERTEPKIKIETSEINGEINQ